MFPKITELLNGKNILILGFGREGRATLDFIREYIKPLSVTVADASRVDDIVGCAVRFGEGYQDGLEKYDVIIKSPGVVYKNPTDEIIAKTTSQTTLFLSEFRDRTIGITGTKGKSTTTSLIYHILKNCSLGVVLAGNIGIPPLSVAHEMLSDEKKTAVLEMSCHQLEYEKYSPHIALILNLYEDHLDHYVTRENYIRAKRNIYKNQNADDVFICNSECAFEISDAVGETLSVGKDGQISVDKDGFTFKGEKIFVDTSSTKLVGYHNIFNIASSYAVTSRYGVGKSDFLKHLKTFQPLSHRLEFVGTVCGVDYYDDSISTVCQTTIQALLSLDNVSTVIVGGMDRGIDYSELVCFFAKNPIENIILLPDSGYRIAHLLDEVKVPYILAKNLEDAVDISVKAAREGTKCVLSPASASYGFFKNFEHRGDMFKEYLKKY